MNKPQQNLVIKQSGLQNYESVWRAMKEFTQTRDEFTLDELWFVEHPSIFTLGLNGKSEHIIDPGTIPILNIDRGGQVTYHGPGQLVVYTLIDLKRLHTGIRDFVQILQQTVIDLLADYAITATGRDDAPGVYVDQAKIAALGLRVKRNCVYHGLALNIDIDLEPFSRINPCGHEDMVVTRLADLTDYKDINEVQQKFIEYFVARMGYNSATTV